MASTSITVWLMPAMMLGAASGSCTLRRVWPRVAPNALDASVASPSTWRMPRLVSRVAAGRA